MPGTFTDPNSPHCSTGCTDRARRSRARSAPTTSAAARPASSTGKASTPTPTASWPTSWWRSTSDKAEFCHALCLATGARRIVEIGTSHGVSTLYLAAAVRANGGGVVIGTEHEAAKAKIAHGHFAEAGLADLIELREGDLRQTLKTLDGPVDFVLMDIWTEMARPAIELLAPHLRPGAVVCADNTGWRTPYEAYFAFIEDPANGFSTMTLPFDGGFEMTVKVP